MKMLIVQWFTKYFVGVLGCMVCRFGAGTSRFVCCSAGIHGEILAALWDETAVKRDRIAVM